MSRVTGHPVPSPQDATCTCGRPATHITWEPRDYPLPGIGFRRKYWCATHAPINARKL